MKRYTPYLIRGGLSAIALLFGVTVVAVSLLNSVPVYSQDTFRNSSRQFYIDNQILPDHVFYPLLMLADRLHLILADEDEEIYLKILYAYERLESSKLLLLKGHESLALDTLTKSQKYLLSAAHSNLDLASATETCAYVKKAFAYHLGQYEDLRDQFELIDTSAISQLIEEGLVLENHLNDCL